MVRQSDGFEPGAIGFCALLAAQSACCRARLPNPSWDAMATPPTLAARQGGLGRPLGTVLACTIRLAVDRYDSDGHPARMLGTRSARKEAFMFPDCRRVALPLVNRHFRMSSEIGLTAGGIARHRAPDSCRVGHPPRSAVTLLVRCRVRQALQ